MVGDRVQDLTSKSSSEYRTLFLWKRRGQGGEKTASMTTPQPLESLGDANLFVDFTVPLFSQKSRANLLWLLNMIQIFGMSSQDYSVYFIAMRLVKWNNPELQWNHFSAHILRNPFPILSFLFWGNLLEKLSFKKAAKKHMRDGFHLIILFRSCCSHPKCLHSSSKRYTKRQFNSCRHFQLIWPWHGTERRSIPDFLFVSCCLPDLHLAGRGAALHSYLKAVFMRSKGQTCWSDTTSAKMGKEGRNSNQENFLCFALWND